MEKFLAAIQFLTIDRKTKDIWQTPGHDKKDKHDEEWHKNTKPEILKALGRKIKNKYGKNCDIAIQEGLIVIISRLFNEEGRRKKIEQITDLKAEDYFERITHFITLSALKLASRYHYKLIVIEQHTEQFNLNLNLYLDIVIE